MEGLTSDPGGGTGVCCVNTGRVHVTYSEGLGGEVVG